LVGGEGYNVIFQQNLNHYNPGWPGYLDVAYSTIPNPTSDDNFTMLAVVPDFWAHLQAAQTNFSVPVLVPTLDCAHCVLRVRYLPHKETESIFHNCADIAITTSGQPKPLNGSMLAFGVSGDRSPASKSQDGILVQLGYNGAVSEVTTTAYANLEAIEGMTAVVGTSLYSIVRTDKDILGSLPANTLVSVDLSNGNTGVSSIQLPSNDPMPPQQWTAIVSAPAWATTVATAEAAVAPQPLVVLGVAPGSEPYTFYYQARLLDPVLGLASSPLATSIPTNTFVNFFWASNVFATGASKGTFYFLGGDENNLVQLDALLFTVVLDLNSGDITNMSSVQQDISQYTLSSLIVHPTTGALYSVSPGMLPSPLYSMLHLQACMVLLRTVS
jgi:hypothetical protein